MFLLFSPENAVSISEAVWDEQLRPAARFCRSNHSVRRAIIGPIVSLVGAVEKIPAVVAIRAMRLFGPPLPTAQFSVVRSMNFSQLNWTGF